MKYAVITFGCRVNQADSLAIEGTIRARGGVEVPAEQAEVVVVNTCSVTASADQAARQTIRRIARHNPDARMIVTGCYATRRPEDLRSLSGVSHVVSNADKDRLLDVVADDLGLTTADRFGDGDGACGAPLTPGVAGRTAFTLRVQTGCNEECSYCIIPRTRGESRSRLLDAVVDDVERAVACGYKEIVITGVHLGAYGRDLGNGVSLTTLVQTLAAWDADVLFRIGSLEPIDCTPRLIELAAGSARIAPHFHLPLQHGSDPILRAMRRPYTALQYSHLVRRVRREIPHASIGSDVIVGFPGESEECFAEMCALLESLPLSYLHVFPYSDRPGTEASTHPGKQDGLVIRERGRRIRALGAEMVRRFRESQAGTTMRALTVDDGRSAVTGNFLKIALETKHPRNQWVQVVTS
jgi:threonylcarbamoyladenosine tRNA methylthiotransferase MtaB